MPLLEEIRAALAGAYRVEREIGSGGTATVYLAEDLKHHRPVAVKVLRPELAALLGPDRFLQEIELSARLTHPHILPLYDSGQAGSFIYYVMPYLEGESLRERLARDRQLPIDEAVHLAREIADALGYAHRQHVVHRDIKPENVLVHEGHAVVADFGIARALTAAGGDRLTRSGVMLGTPAYMSPEQATGSGDLDARSDLYSLACLLYEMISGQPPFVGPSAETLVHQHLSVEPRPVNALRPSTPPAVTAAITRSLAKVAADRHPSAEAFARDLAPAQRETPVASPAPPAPTSRTIRPAVSARALVAIVVVALALAGAWAVLRSRARPPAAERGAVAVLPFTVRGSQELAYLGEGMVDLLSTSLDGAAELRRVDPHALLGHLRRAPAGMSPQVGLRVARHFGADLFVLGDVMQIGRGLRLQASLYEGASEPKLIASGAVEGDEERISALVDELAVKLLSEYTGRRVDLGGRLARLASVTTRSLPALKSYLRGEQHMRRGEYERALEAFQEATQADTTFALAWYRLSMAAGWISGPNRAPDAEDRAVRHADHLTERDRRLLLSNQALMQGRIEEAEAHALEVSRSHPEDAASWLALGEALFHGNPFRGRSVLEAREALERASFLDPENTEPLNHLIEIAARSGRYSAMDSLIALRNAWSPGVDDSIAMAMLQSAIHRDRGRLEALIARMPELSRFERLFAVGAVAAVAEQPATAEQLYARLFTSESPATKAWVESLRAAMLLATGKRRAAVEALKRSERLDETTGIALGALIAGSPMPGFPDHVVRGKMGALARLRGPGPGDTLGSGTFWSRNQGLGKIIPAYLRGLLASRLGEDQLALASAQEIDRNVTRDPNLAPELARGLRARVAWTRRRPEEAAEILGPPVAWAWIGPPGIRNRIHERFLRAELLHATGRHEEALGWYESLTQLDPQSVMYLAPSYLRRAEIEERLGRRALAIAHYRRFVDLWAECDPELRPAVDRAREGIERLTAQGA